MWDDDEKREPKSPPPALLAWLTEAELPVLAGLLDQTKKKQTRRMVATERFRYRLEVERLAEKDPRLACDELEEKVWVGRNEDEED